MNKEKPVSKINKRRGRRKRERKDTRNKVRGVERGKVARERRGGKER